MGNDRDHEHQLKSGYLAKYPALAVNLCIISVSLDNSFGVNHGRYKDFNAYKLGPDGMRNCQRLCAPGRTRVNPRLMCGNACRTSRPMAVIIATNTGDRDERGIVHILQANGINFPLDGNLSVLDGEIVQFCSDLALKFWKM